MNIKEVLEHKWLQKFCGKNDDTVLQRSIPFVTEYSADLMILHSKN